VAREFGVCVDVEVLVLVEFEVFVVPDVELVVEELVEVGAEEGERVLVVRITLGPRISVASEFNESKLFCETATHVSPGAFFQPFS